MAPSAIADNYRWSARPYSNGKVPIHASVLVGPKHLVVETKSISAPGPHEVQVEVKATGLCGSDVSYYNKFRNGDLQAVAPLTLGHESAGEVVAVGELVTSLAIGDRVALEVGVPCDDCRACQRGRYNLCPKMRFRSSAKSVPHYQGTLQERINHPAKWCHKIPAHVSLEAAALLEPLSVAIHATRRSSIEAGDTVLVFGAGTVGLLVAAMAKLKGATTVMIADLDAGRLDYAIRNGFATHRFHVSKRKYSADMNDITDKLELGKDLATKIVAEACEAEPDLEGVDVTFDCTGKEICMQTGLYATRPGGQLVMVGMGTPIQTLPMSASHLKEVDIIGIFRYANTYPYGIKILSSGQLPSLDNMVTHRFRGLQAVQDAFELAGKTQDADGNLVLKVVIEM